MDDDMNLLEEISSEGTTADPDDREDLAKNSQKQGIRWKLHDLINGKSEASSVYGKSMSFIIIISLIPLCFKQTWPIFTVIEYICTAIFILDYLVRWITADYQYEQGLWSFLVYPFRPMAIIDLLSILPSFLALNSVWRSLRTLRLFRAVRAFKFIRYSKSVRALARVILKQKESLAIVLFFSLGYVAITAVLIFNVEPQTFHSFFDALYWAVVSLTTVGYGDLYPTTEVGKVIAMLSSIMGVVVVAMPSGIITAGLVDELKRESRRTL